MLKDLACEQEEQSAVALQYDSPSELPKVLLSGSGEVARFILSLAEKNGVPIEENSELVNLLAGLEKGAEIRKDSFRLVAEILAFLYHVDEAWQKQHSFMKEIVS